jgi:CubicO group peptidase (beta-lactamase class C family)
VSGFDADRVARLGRVLDGRVDALAWLVDRDGEVEAGTSGCDRDAIFRIASMTKPVLAVAALQLVEACALRLDDLLTFRLGSGMDFEAGWPQPILQAMAELGLGDGPPSPSGVPAPDEWMRRFATLPLLRQPGERWLYNTGAEVLGVVVARVAGRPLVEVLQDRIFGPLGMTSTGFWTSDVDRLVTGWAKDPATGERVVYDPPDGQWSSAPDFPSGGGGLLSTIDDFHAFARMLRARGVGPDGERLLSPASVAAMTTDHLADGRTTGSPDPTGALGWGFGVGVQRRRLGIGRGPGSYGWDGGLVTSWANDPAAGLIGIVLTNQMFDGPFPPPAVIRDFWTAAYTALT